MEITYGYYSRRYDLSKSRNREYERMLDIADSQNGNVPAGTDIFKKILREGAECL